MKLTKYGHACVVLEEQGKRLIIDPGELTHEFGNPQNTVAVVVTHVHFDHLNRENLQKIIEANPDVKVYTTPRSRPRMGRPSRPNRTKRQRTNRRPVHAKILRRSASGLATQPKYRRFSKRRVLLPRRFVYQAGLRRKNPGCSNLRAVAEDQRSHRLHERSKPAAILPYPRRHAKRRWPIHHR